MQKTLDIHGNHACYHGNRHRYLGNIGLNGNYGRSQYGATPLRSEGGGAQAYSTGNTPTALRGVDNTTFYDKSFKHMLGKDDKFRGSNMLRFRDIRLLILNFVSTVIL